MARRLSMPQLLMGKRLGLLSALPCHPWWLPKPHLSETILFHAQFLRFDALWPTLLPYLRTLHRLAMGDPRAWRLRD